MADPDGARLYLLMATLLGSGSVSSIPINTLEEGSLADRRLPWDERARSSDSGRSPRIVEANTQQRPGPLPVDANTVDTFMTSGDPVVGIDQVTSLSGAEDRRDSPDEELWQLLDFWL